MRGARHRQPTTDGAALPWELLALRILPLLPLEDRIQLATVSKAWAAAVRLNVRGVAIQLGRRSRDLPRRFLRGQTDGGRLALVFPNPASTLSAAAAAAQAGRWDPHEQRLWCEAGRGRPPRPAAAAWHLRRAASAVAGGTQAGARPRSLALLLVGPELDTSAAEVHSMLVAAGAEALFASVCVPLGLLRLDGALGQALNWCNARVAGLASCLQAPTCYSRLERLALQLGPSDDLQPAWEAIRPGALPALSCLALVAAPGAGMAADLAPLSHAGLSRLDLHGVQLPAGFACLTQLSGLHTLAVRFEEGDDVAPLNVQGDLSALSALSKLRDLSLDCLASGEGLAALTQLTSLALAPQQGARIALRGLPRLRRLALDLSSGSCGWDLLSPDRSSAHVPAGGHGLASLAELELRCFVWRHYCEAGAASDDGGGSGGSSETAADTDSSGDGSDGEEADSLAADEEGMEEEGAAGADAAWPEEEEGEAEDGGHPAGLLQASWGFLQELQPPAAGGPDLAAAALAALEQRYLRALLERLPTLKTVLLTDSMGLVHGPDFLGSHPAAKPGAAGPLAKESAGAGAGGRAESPGLLGAAACSLAGWRRVVAETPVEGGISQFDVRFTLKS